MKLWFGSNLLLPINQSKSKDRHLVVEQKMNRRCTLCLLVTLFILSGQNVRANFDPFSDSIPYSIKWSGPLDPADLNKDGVITLPIVTNNNEKYQCLYKDEQETHHHSSENKPYSGPSPAEILTTFAKSTSCSYRVESYWTYELCHGKTFRQYHEEPSTTEDTGTVVSQEYFLGKYAAIQMEQKDDNTIILEGTKYKYYEVTYNDGTECDLTKAPRRITVQYICHESGRGDLYQIKETSTCEYNAVVLIAELCQHPDFVISKEASRIISCHSMEGAPAKPKMQSDIDQKLAQRPVKPTKIVDSKVVRSSTTSKPPTEEKGTTKAAQDAVRTDVGSAEDQIFLHNFLSGEYCLQGGTGWWSFELCYGKTVKQYHLEGGKRVTNILLGKWVKTDHMTWLEKNPAKRPRAKPNRKYISQLYTGGEFCDETKRQRQVEVKLKCSKTVSSSSHAVAIYLLEPKTCDYILTVESSVLCSLVDKVDNNGLIDEYP